MTGFRRFIIRLVEILLIVFVVLGTLISAFAGWSYGQFSGGGMSLIMLVTWGFGGFVSAALVAAFYFLLAEIAENTRRS